MNVGVMFVWDFVFPFAVLDALNARFPNPSPACGFFLTHTTNPRVLKPMLAWVNVKKPSKLGRSIWKK